MRRSDLRQRVLNFCGENPEVVDTCEGLARWVGCRGEEIRPVLEILVEEGLLIRKGRAGQTLYFARDRQPSRRQQCPALRSRERKREG